jgi:hypothetical protein
MTLLDPPAEPQGKSSALKFTLIAVILAAIIGGWFLFRYYPEKRAVSHFFDALVASDTARAYQNWKPSESYKMGDFLADWGPSGYYGPVKSYKIMRAEAPKKSNGVIVSVAVSPFSPMPEANDAEKSRRTKVIPIWVDTETKAMSFSPVTPEE